jgi:hypothetical protein
MPQTRRPAEKDFSWIYSPEASTGFTHEDLEAIYQKYCGRNTPLNSRVKLYNVLKWCKTYPTARVSADRPGGSCRGYGFELSRNQKAIDYLASVVDELTLPIEQRFELSNKIPIVFSRLATGSIDTFPWRVQRRKVYMNQRVLYQGKYKGHVVKFQGLIDNLGNWLWFSGPHPGSDGDGTLWKNYRPPWMIPNELALADKAYCSRVYERLGLVAPYKKPTSGARTRAQTAYNRIHTFHRVRVEHAYGYLKRFEILSRRYRGRVDKKGVKKMFNIMKVLVHLSQLHRNRRPRGIVANCLDQDNA